MLMPLLPFTLITPHTLLLMLPPPFDYADTPCRRYAIRDTRLRCFDYRAAALCAWQRVISMFTRVAIYVVSLFHTPPLFTTCRYAFTRALRCYAFAMSHAEASMLRSDCYGHVTGRTRAVVCAARLFLARREFGDD